MEDIKRTSFSPDKPFENIAWSSEEEKAQAEEARLKKAEKKRQQRKSAIIEWGIALFVALLIAVVLTQFVFINAQIPSESMENTIMTGDRVLGFRFSYWIDGPQRGDIIIFEYPDDPENLFVKRVIGLPGDVVEIRDGLVYLNGSETPLDEPYVTTEVPTGDYGPYVVPQNSYFVLGDNRNHSLDSRYWQNTFVTRDALVGRAVVRIFPQPKMLE